MRGKIGKAKLSSSEAAVRSASAEEVGKLLAVLGPAPSYAVFCADRDLYDFFVVGINTGFRLSELTHLRWDTSVDFHKNALRIVPQEDWQPKTPTSVRTVAMRPEVRQVMQRRFAERGTGVYVFGGDAPWKAHMLQEKFRNAYRRAGIKKCNIHTFRHSFASHAVLSGVDLYTLSRLLGHSSVKTTEVYSQLTQGHLDGAVKRITFDSGRPILVEKRAAKCERFVKVQESRNASVCESMC